MQPRVFGLSGTSCQVRVVVRVTMVRFVRSSPCTDSEPKKNQESDSLQEGGVSCLVLVVFFFFLSFFLTDTELASKALLSSLGSGS